MIGHIEVLRGLEKEWQEYVDKHDGGYSHVEGVKKCLSELRAALAAMGGEGEVQPVAWVIPEDIDNVAWHDGHTTPGIKPYSTDERTQPLYTTPPPSAVPAEQPEAQGELVAEPPSGEVWPPDGAVWLAPVATDAPADPRLMQYAWGRSTLSSGQMAEAYQCIVSAAQECGQVYRLPLAAPATQPAQVPAIPEHVRKLVGRIDRYRLCMSYNESYFGEPVGLLKGVMAELAGAVNAIYPSGETALYPAKPKYPGVVIYSEQHPEGIPADEVLTAAQQQEADRG